HGHHSPYINALHRIWSETRRFQHRDTDPHSGGFGQEFDHQL
ncbi:hypothetical protein LCGC14_1980970, partial [marine sediment metagenome]